MYLFKKKPKKTRDIINKVMSNGIHSIREPLHSCVWIVDKIVDQLETEKFDTNEIKNNLKKVQNLNKYLKTVVNNFVGILNMNIDSFENLFSNVNVIFLLNEIHEIYNFKNSNNDIKFVLNINTHVTNLYINENNLKQILFNAYKNAVKYTEKGVITTNVYTSDNKFFIEIIDTGCGLKNKIDYFFIKKNISNLGIGIHLSKFLATRMMGNISVENRKDSQGVIFTVWFTIQYNKVSDENFYTIPLDVKLKRNIFAIIVEDDDTNNEILQDMMIRIGIEKFVAFKDGVECLDYVKKNNTLPDIFVVDIILTKMNGDTLCKELRKMGTIKPCIAVTGNLLTDEIITEYKKCGFNDIISKPYNLTKLKNSIYNLL